MSFPKSYWLNKYPKSKLLLKKKSKHSDFNNIYLKKKPPRNADRDEWQFKSVMSMVDLGIENIAKIVSFTSSKDACRLALVCSGFRAAADSDVVWERFLPPDYQEIICKFFLLTSSSLKLLSKKVIYFYLCDHPIVFHNDTMVSQKLFDPSWDYFPSSLLLLLLPNDSSYNCLVSFLISLFSVENNINFTNRLWLLIYNIYIICVSRYL